MKGIIFAGDSFTWGQGLHHYSELPTVVEPKNNQYIKSEYRNSHLNYIKTVRFPRLVANYFNTFEIVQFENGGNEDVSFEFINHLFEYENNPIRNHLYNKEKYYTNEIEYIILQTSAPDRNIFPFIFNDKQYIFNVPYASTKKDKNEFEPGMADFDIFYEWLKFNNKTYEEWYDEFLKYILNNVKEQFIFYEKLGIKTKIFCWKSDYIKIIKNDEFLNNRFIKLKYNNTEYDCIDDLTKEFPNLIIANDFVNFKNPPQDSHVSKECHDIISNSIIENIEKCKNIYNIEYTKESGKIYPTKHQLQKNLI